MGCAKFELYKGKSKILIYGAGVCGEKVFTELNPMLEVVGFIDRDEEKQNKTLKGVPIYSPEYVLNNDDIRAKHLIIIGMMQDKAEKVKNKLILHGYIESVDFFCWEQFADSTYLLIYALYGQNRLVLSSLCVVPSTLCNLKCKGCLNFSSSIPAHAHVTRSYEDVCTDIDMIFQYCDYTPRLQVSGGEPLLYKDLDKVLIYIDEKYRNRINRIETIFNGTVVPNDKVLTTLKEHHIFVYLDNYIDQNPHIKKTYNIIKEKLEKWGIEWFDNYVPEWFDLDVFHTDHSEWQDEKLINYHDECGNPWNCLDTGKIYLCNFARFASKAKIYNINENDFFRLDKVTFRKKVELLEFTLGYSKLGYSDFCKRCSGWNKINKKKIKVAEQLL